MKKFGLRLSAAGVAVFLVCSLALAADYKLGNLTIAQPWARPSAVANGAAYFTIENKGASEDTLVAAKTPLADKAEIHEHVMEGDVMRMRPVEGGLKIPAGGSVALKAGGYHLMLIGLKQKLKAGDTVPLTLTFAKAGDVSIDVNVGQPQSQASGDHMHMHTH